MLLCHAQVSFKDVHARFVSRDVGGCGVPASGAWALSLLKPFADAHLGTVDEFETRRTIEIEERMKSLSKRERKAATGETRQLSHRKEVRFMPACFPSVCM